MKIAAFSTAALLFAGAAAAQTAPQTAPRTPSAQTQPPSSLTSDLNSGPPARADYIAPAPSTAAPATAVPPANAPRLPPSAPVRIEPTPRIAPIPSPPASQPRTAPITPDAPPAARVEPLAPPAAAPRTVTPTPAPVRPAAAPPAGAVAASPIPVPAPTPAPAPTPPPPAPNVPTVTVLDAAAREALPFTVELPRGFEIVTGRPGPNFKIYTIRRGERSFVMVYAGPNSQFPIYSGEQVEIPGRSSIVATEDGVRHAMEHLFRRSVEPLEVHVWTMTLEGADRALAEQIAQTITAR